MTNVWKTLSQIDVSNHIETKNNLHYLSWGWAWSTLCQHYGDSSYTYSEPRWCDKTNTVEVELKRLLCTVWVCACIWGR